MPDIFPTPEQLAIIQATRSSSESLMIVAYAGCAKTTTLTLAAKEVRVPGLALAFNRSIRDELKKKFPSNFSVQTMNGLGFASLRRALPRIADFTIDPKKLGKLVSEVGKDFKIELSSEQWEQARNLVTLAQLAGIVPGGAEGALTPDEPEVWASLAEDFEDSNLLIEIAYEVLRRNNDLALRRGIVSFDDQIYISTCIAGKFPQFPVLMVDEAQDLNPLQHRMLELASRKDGRFIVVGDPKQAIYAFRGADTNSLAKIERLRGAWTRLPLRTTFRCPKAIVARHQAHVPGFTAAPGAPQGIIARLPRPDTTTWAFPDFATLAAPSESLAILCRNNAPLLKLAFRLLRRRVVPHIIGRDIGTGLIALSRKLAPQGGSCEAFAEALAEWQLREEAKAVVNRQEEKIEGIRDKAESIRAVMEHPGIANVRDLQEALRELFSNEKGAVTLSTIHKAKGLEWDVVMMLDPWRLPSAKAREAAAAGRPEALEQEKNLRYVGETRAKRVLVLADLATFA